MKVILEYRFMFDPDKTWTNKEGFEGFLANSLSSIGMKAERVKGAEENTNILYITVVPQMPVADEEAKTVKQVKAELSRNRGYDGKFRK